MNHNRRRMAGRARYLAPEKPLLPTMSHEEATVRARELGCPPFCGSWPTGTLIEKIKEKENATS